MARTFEGDRLTQIDLSPFLFYTQASTMLELRYNSSFTNNAIYILDCLKSNELQTAIRLEQELLDLKNEIKAPLIERISIHSREDFFRVIEEIRHLCRRGVRPILHIECHGDNTGGISVGDRMEYITAKELLKHFRKINSVTNNNLGIIMSGCHGMHAIRAIEITKPCPFYFLIGSEDEVTAGLIDETMKRFYRALFENDSLQSAMDQIDEKFKQFHAERMFCIAYAGYLKRHCMGAGRTARVEKLLTKVMENGVPRNRENIRRYRKELKSSTKPNLATFRKFADRFMHQRYSITFDQLNNFIRQ